MCIRDSIKAMREMIVADNTTDRKKALDKILPYQQGDFEGIYEAMEGCPVVIRFLDPPLHEFLPTKEEDIREIAAELGITCLLYTSCPASTARSGSRSPRRSGCSLCRRKPVFSAET